MSAEKQSGYQILSEQRTEIIHKISKIYYSMTGQYLKWEEMCFKPDPNSAKILSKEENYLFVELVQIKMALEVVAKEAENIKSFLHNKLGKECILNIIDKLEEGDDK